MRLRGWAITGWVTAGLLVLNALLLLAYGWNEEGIRVVVRSTARSSIVLFALAFGASSLYRLAPARATGWLLRNRRYVGVSFALSHFLHADALIALARVSPRFVNEELSAVTLVGGGLAYVFIAAMAITSTDRTAAWLTPRNWKRLHTVGGYYVWIIFAQSYIPRALMEPAYIPAAVLVVAILAVRLAVRLKRPQAAPASARVLLARDEGPGQR